MFFRLKSKNHNIYGSAYRESQTATIFIENIAKDAANPEISQGKYCAFLTDEIYKTILHETLHLLMWKWRLRFWSSEKKISYMENCLFAALIDSPETKLGFADFYNILKGEEWSRIDPDLFPRGFGSLLLQTCSK